MLLEVIQMNNCCMGCFSLSLDVALKLQSDPEVTSKENPQFGVQSPGSSSGSSSVPFRNVLVRFGQSGYFGHRNPLGTVCDTGKFQQWHQKGTYWLLLWSLALRYQACSGVQVQEYQERPNCSWLGLFFWQNFTLKDFLNALVQVLSSDCPIMEENWLVCHSLIMYF